MINGKYPIETAFMSNSDNSRRDTLKPNRIYFKLPETWCNSQNDSVIGIRNIFISKSFKHPILEFNYRLWEEVVDIDISIQSPSPPTTTTTFIYGDTYTVDKFFDDETMMKDCVKTFNEFLSLIDITSKLPKYYTITENEQTIIHYGLTDNKLEIIKNTALLSVSFEYVVDSTTKEHYNRLVISSPFNGLTEETRSYLNSGAFPSPTTVSYYITFDVTLKNADAQSMFGTKQFSFIIRDENGNDITDINNNKYPIYFNRIWDRNSCIVYSNISEQSDNGYLGHTRKQSLQAIKYYPIKGNKNIFWVELYSTCDHKAAVILPEGDELIIEAQLL